MEKLILINIQAHVKHNIGHFSSCKSISFLIVTLESCERYFFFFFYCRQKNKAQKS